MPSARTVPLAGMATDLVYLIVLAVLLRLGTAQLEAVSFANYALVVAVVAVVGNEDGAHKVTADVMQGLNDVGFTLPAQGGTYWVGEAMQKTDFADLPEVPDAVASTIALQVSSGVHLAHLLREHRYPGAGA